MAQSLGARRGSSRRAAGGEGGLENKNDEAVVARRARFLKRLLHAAVSSDSLENLTFSPHLALKVRLSSSRSAYDTGRLPPPCIARAARSKRARDDPRSRDGRDTPPT